MPINGDFDLTPVKITPKINGSFALTPVQAADSPSEIVGDFDLTPVGEEASSPINGEFDLTPVEQTPKPTGPGLLKRVYDASKKGWMDVAGAFGEHILADQPIMDTARAANDPEYTQRTGAPTLTKGRETTNFVLPKPVLKADVDQQYQDTLKRLIATPEEDLPSQTAEAVINTPLPEKIVKGAASSVAGTVGATGGLAKWVGADKMGDFLNKYSEEMYKFYDIPDKDFVYRLASGFGSMAQFYIPGVGVGASTTKLALYAPRLASLLGVGTSTALEAMTEAGTSWNHVHDKKKAEYLAAGQDEATAEQWSQEEANSAAGKDFVSNAVLVGLTNKYGIFQKAGSKGLRVAGSTAMESLQEGGQQVISNMVANDPVMEGVLESALIGGITGGVVKGVEVIGENFQRRRAVIEDLKSKVSDMVIPKEGVAAETTQEEGDISFPMEQGAIAEGAPETETLELQTPRDVLNQIAQQESEEALQLEELKKNKIQDSQISLPAQQESQDDYDAMPLEAKTPSLFEISNDLVVRPQDREFAEKISEIKHPDLSRDAVVNFAKSMNIPITERQRGVPRGTSGYIVPDMNGPEIYITDINNLTTLSHEVGHGVHIVASRNGENIPKFVMDNAKEFTRVSQYARPIIGKPSAKHLHYRESWQELFGDYMSVYLFQPEKARELSPNITRAIDETLTRLEMTQSIEQVRQTANMDDSDMTIEKIGESLADVVHTTLGTANEGMPRASKQVFNLIGTPYWRGMNNPKFLNIYRAIFDNLTYGKTALENDWFKRLEKKDWDALPKVSRDKIMLALFEGNLPSEQRYKTTKELIVNYAMTEVEIKEYHHLVDLVKSAVMELHVEAAKFKTNYYAIENPAIRFQLEEDIRANIQRLGGYVAIFRNNNFPYRVWAETVRTQGTFPYFQSFATERLAKEEAKRLETRGYNAQTIHIYRKGEIAKEALEKWKLLSNYQAEALREDLEKYRDDPKVAAVLDEMGRAKISLDIKREWVPGYLQNEDAFWAGLHDLVTRGITELSKNKAAYQAYGELNKIKTRGVDAQLYSYASRYVKDAFTLSGDGLKFYTQFAYIWFLSFRASWLMVNLSQPIMTTLPWLTSEVGAVKSALIWKKALVYAKGNATQEFKDMLVRATNEGMLRASFSEDMLMDLKTKDPDAYGIFMQNVSKFMTYSVTPVFARNALLKVGSILTQKNFNNVVGFIGYIGEKLNRSHALATAYLAGKEKGLQGEALYTYLKNFNSTTQMDYGQLNYPEAVRAGMRVTKWAKLGYTFGTFVNSYTSFLTFLSKAAIGFSPSHKGWQPPTSRAIAAAGQAWLSALLLAGLLGAPIPALLLWLYKKTNPAAKDPYLAMAEKNAAAADLIFKGGPALMGVDLHRSAGTGDTLMGYFTKNPLENMFGIWGSIYRNISYARADFSSGKNIEAIMHLSPLALQSLEDVFRIMDEQKHGLPPTSGGYALPRIPGKGNQRVNTLELAQRALGFQPSRWSHMKDIHARQYEIEKTQSKIASIAAKRIAEGYMMNNQKLIAKGKKVIFDWNSACDKNGNRKLKLKLSPTGITNIIGKEMFSFKRGKKGASAEAYTYIREMER